jgi:predicted esterase YcpF (UPF0227 family)
MKKKSNRNCLEEIHKVKLANKNFKAVIINMAKKPKETMLNNINKRENMIQGNMIK